MSDKKKLQLGMNPSTAAGRLTKDILWMLIVETGRDVCFRCSEKMSRETFSIEHKEPWLDSHNPVELYFDLDNISFSHLSCNCKETRQFKHSSEEARLEARRSANRKSWTKEKRREYYERSGK